MKDTLNKLLNDVKNFLASLDYKKICVVFVILAVIGGLIYNFVKPRYEFNINNQVSDSSEAKVNFEDLLTKYSEVYRRDMPQNDGDEITVLIDDLIDVGLLSPSKINPNTKEAYKNEDVSMKIVKVDGVLEYLVEYSD